MSQHDNSHGTPHDRRGQRLARIREILGKPLFLYDPIAYWAGELEPTWVRHERRARIVEVREIAGETKTFVLETAKGRWAGHRPGQFVPITVEIDGRRHTRCYSISSAPRPDRLAITVRRHPEGLVSGHLHDRVRPGDVFVVGDPGGELTLPERPAKLLLVAGGSGVTPMRSMLSDLVVRGSNADVELLYFERSDAHVILDRVLLAALAERCPNVRVHIFTGASKPRLSLAWLAGVVPDFASRTALACGPDGVVETMTEIYAATGRVDRLTTERFAPKTTERAVAGQPVVVTLSRSLRTLRLDGHGSLLEQLEREGVKPNSGCRMGICHTCRCKKTSGAVEDLRSGQLHEATDESIQLCVTAPRSDLVLDL
jgi:stearoyl-CoA 9-desaturase NADPH oxidoreductase